MHRDCIISTPFTHIPFFVGGLKLCEKNRRVGLKNVYFFQKKETCERERNGLFSEGGKETEK